jgi:hypothetical protein
VIQQLLEGLRDKDTCVRWSAAKGLGRVTMRLPWALADQVVEGLLEMFSDAESDGAWHGGCMALAELATRGLLLPARLSAVVPVTLKALSYDVRTGAHSVGAHVRDAACYVVWAFARSYAPEVMQPFVADLARGLLTIAVFDREINVRRAAAAAFQENVGRQGNFPHGIAINTTADYFSLGNRANAYLAVAVAVAQYAEYREHLAAHLLLHKTGHWDAAVRALAAQSLRRLMAVAPLRQVLCARLVEAVVPGIFADDVLQRHGSCLAAAEMLRGLSDAGEGVPPRVAAAVLGVFEAADKAQILMGRGGLLVRVGLCRLIESIAHAAVDVPAKMVQRLQVRVRHSACGMCR